MKSKLINERTWTVALWVVWCLILLMFAFGAAVQVDFTEPEVPFAEAWAHIDTARVERVFQKSEYFWVWVISLVSVLIHTFATPWKIRCGVMIAGFLVPVFAITPLMAVIMFVSPLVAIEVLLGTPDGEFYNEEWPMVGACGLWMIVCLVFAARQAFVGWCEKKRIKDTTGIHGIPQG